MKKLSLLLLSSLLLPLHSSHAAMSKEETASSNKKRQRATTEVTSETGDPELKPLTRKKRKQLSAPLTSEAISNTQRDHIHNTQPCRRNEYAPSGSARRDSRFLVLPDGRRSEASSPPMMPIPVARNTKGIRPDFWHGRARARAPTPDMP